ncbi:hypothetical protein AZE42_14170 [Rhizopogon vesiculosus]|uniref:Uncharacterized protein n=1 Tax=Rhizopogon vesiculosus TaxID=180088 RepID=A0A1J8QAQ1_9AGAM|nr:hypothetical protein AZE42_14170 [Rhizopogon vesiculosus]
METNFRTSLSKHYIQL